MQLHEEIGAVRRETVVEAPRDAVWPLLSEPAGLEGWLADEVELDAVAPGERGVLVEDGEARLVTVEEVEEGRRVALTWCAPGGEPSLVELTLEADEDPAATRVVVVEIPLATLRAVTAVPVAAGGRARGPQMAAV
ncbi:MAG TPA: SRPBCC domain-containing protein [Baekduia sp.]|nr:SRPBCC domain-containing protein [Baekduia sp.]